MDKGEVIFTCCCCCCCCCCCLLWFCWPCCVRVWARPAGMRCCGSAAALAAPAVPAATTAEPEVLAALAAPAGAPTAAGSGLAKGPAPALSELLRCMLRRGLFMDRAPCCGVATITTTLIVGTVVAAAPLDAAPGVSSRSTPPTCGCWRPGRGCCLRGLRDRTGDSAKARFGSMSTWPCAELLHSVQRRLQWPL